MQSHVAPAHDPPAMAYAPNGVRTRVAVLRPGAPGFAPAQTQPPHSLRSKMGDFAGGPPTNLQLDRGSVCATPG